MYSQTLGDQQETLPLAEARKVVIKGVGYSTENEERKPVNCGAPALRQPLPRCGLEPTLKIEHSAGSHFRVRQWMQLAGQRAAQL